MITVICGGRNQFLNIARIEALEKIRASMSFVISGGATGIDNDCILWAKVHGIPNAVYYAEWKRHGKKAGILRNIEMSKMAEQCIVFKGGKGTAHMKEICIKRGIKVIDFSHIS